MLAGMLGNGPRGDEPGPFEYSPYVPASRLFLNELFIDLEAIPELAACQEALSLLSLPATRHAMAELAKAGLVDYRRQMALKRRVLEALAERFFEDAPAERRAAFEGFRRDNPAVEDYARFRAVTEHYGAPWQAWPEPARSGHPATEDVDPHAFRYHLYAQWIAHEQLTALARRARKAGGGLYLDMPLGVAGDGYDAWLHQGLFATEATGGAPPDAFFSKGQNWGFPPIHPERSRAEGHRYWIESIRRLARVAGALRIDHVMGLHRLYWIPQGMAATEGVYVRYPSEELYAILCLESARNRCRVIGENLGTVPPAVNAAMERHGMAGMHVLQFSVQPNGETAIDPPPPGSVASLNTHDMPTFAAWWAGHDLNMQLEMGLLSPDQHADARKHRDWTRDAMLYFLRRHELLAKDDDSTGGVLEACLRWLAQSQAELVLINLEDLWLEKRPQNVPGTGPEERPNWRRRAALAFEDWTARPDCVRILAEIDALRRAS
jgi:4-alpha-glucanotransferase